jgi:hypothetical protein
MMMKLNFSNALAISPNQVQDLLVIHIRERRDHFISKTQLKDLHRNYTTLSLPIKKQLIDESLSYSLISASENSKVTLKSSFIGTFILNIVLQGAMHFILSMIRSLQLIIHLPIMSMVIPSNVMTMFNILIPIVMFDVLEDLQIFNEIFPDSEEDSLLYMQDYS